MGSASRSAGGSHHLADLDIFGNLGWGVNAPQPSDGNNVVSLELEHCLLRGNGSGAINHFGYIYTNAVTLEIRNCTIADNGGTAIYRRGSQVLVSNSIIVASGTGGRCLDADPGWPAGSFLSDYNDLWPTAGARISAGQADLTTWQAETGQDAHSLSADPLFVNRTEGDYHLQSTGGSWHGGSWTADAADSTCVDAGGPGRTDRR